jgi:bacterioferritin
MNSRKAGSKLIEALNHALSLEYGAIKQYAQHHFCVSGHERVTFGQFFLTNSNEAHLHAINLGNKIVSLGGVPTLESADARQAVTIDEMLRQDLELEREALSAYTQAWELAEGLPSLRFWLEDIIRAEQLHVEELEKLTAAQSMEMRVESRIRSVK